MSKRFFPLFNILFIILLMTLIILNSLYFYYISKIIANISSIDEIKSFIFVLIMGAILLVQIIFTTINLYFYYSYKDPNIKLNMIIASFCIFNIIFLSFSNKFLPHNYFYIEMSDLILYINLIFLFLNILALFFENIYFERFFHTKTKG